MALHSPQHRQPWNVLPHEMLLRLQFFTRGFVFILFLRKNLRTR